MVEPSPSRSLLLGVAVGSTTGGVESGVGLLLVTVVLLVRCVLFQVLSSVVPRWVTNQIRPCWLVQV